MGKRKGLKGARSGLIYEVLRLTDELRPKMLFLENVPALVLDGLGEVIKEFVDKRGYELRWAVVPASAVGAPHNRRRWYGLLIRRDIAVAVAVAGEPLKLGSSLGQYKVFNWGKEPVQRMVIPRNMDEKRRMLAYVSRLGNSVVPDAVRAAFIVLASGFRVRLEDVLVVSNASKTRRRHLMLERVDVKELDAVDIVKTDDKSVKKGVYSSWGVVSVPASASVSVSASVSRRAGGGGGGRGKGSGFKGKYVGFEVPAAALKAPSLKLVFDPRTFKAKSTGPVTSGLVEKPVLGRAWSTPRFTVPLCNVLTRRSVRDLATQVRFERGTPDRLRGGILNPAFIEWLMGVRSA